MKFTKLSSYIVYLLLILTACRKSDQDQAIDKFKNNSTPQKASLNKRIVTNEMLQKVVNALEAQRDTSTPHQAAKIDTLLANLLDKNPVQLTLNDEIDIIFCDLAGYRNQSIPNYANTYYKAYFCIQNGQIARGGLIYTIHTNYSKDAIDADFENIFLQKSNSFTGMTVSNYLNDQFVQALVFENGKPKKSYNIDFTDGNGRSASSSTNCTPFYLVTTTYYADGTIEQNWQYLFTVCGDCVPTGQPVTTLIADCDPDGGGGNGPNEIEIEKTTFEEIIEDEAATSCQSKMEYNVYSHKKDGVTYDVTADPAYCSNPVWDCTYKNKAVSKRTQVGSHTPIVTPLSMSWSVDWIYTNFYTYVFYDGSPTETSSRFNNKTRIAY